MNFKTFQDHAKKTDMHPSIDPDSLAIPILGLLGEAGSLATAYKKYLRDGVPWESNKSFIQQELGDLLWYISTIATHCNLDLDEIAKINLDRTDSRYGANWPHWDDERVAKSLDEDFPATEKFPRKMQFLFEESSRRDGEKIVAMTLVFAEPNIFSTGVIQNESGKIKGFTLGSPLTNNSWLDDGYRYHDALHVAFLGILGWSPVLRSLLRLKRKSDPKVDECEDGARAYDVEEGISSLLARRAPQYNSFLETKNVDNDTLDIIVEHIKGLEVQNIPTWAWKYAISHGFQMKKDLQENAGGYVSINLDEHSVEYSTTLKDW
jgi:NTP pyrophosphatase (non-canonical NTP hydrolase)